MARRYAFFKFLANGVGTPEFRFLNLVDLGSNTPTFRSAGFQPARARCPLYGCSIHARFY
ncbi:hypothetical protein [Egbenema bharatensis]|uniref:hypothetical protein n=1 Tax=Egbenema bharatensis TaxID=3463334 RepID=UPI003A8AD7DD